MKRTQFLIVALFFTCFLKAQETALPRSSPEAQGVSSKDLLRFVDSLNASGVEFHSLMLIRHGKVIAEGWWKPYAAELKHTMYSVSKSFTSTAIGFAVSEGKLKVSDKVVSFFPDQLPDTVSPFLAQLTVKDLLSMAVGQEPDPTGPVVSSATSWVKAFLALPILYKPGTKFLYNSMASYCLSAIVQKVTGQKVLDYLTPRLFQPLGIKGIDWELDPKGINTGGWGLRLGTEDMAKFGLLLLQNGEWNGKQVLPKAWVEEATTKKIDQRPVWVADSVNKDTSDWAQGYCYQFWRCRNNAFRADGAFGQFIIVMPDQDAVLAITAETPNMQKEINLVWKNLLGAMQKNKLPEDQLGLAALKSQLGTLGLPTPPKTPVPAAAKELSGKWLTVDSNSLQVTSMSFLFQDSVCQLSLKTDTADYKLEFGSGFWKKGETRRRGPYLVAAAKANRNNLPPFKVAGAYTWKDDNTLELTLNYIEGAHDQRYICHFNKDKVSVEVPNPINPKDNPELKGALKN